MWKKIVIGLIISIFVAGGIYWFTYTKELHTPVSDAINAIPSNAAFVFESKQSKNTWKKLSQANVMWEALLGAETFAKLHTQAHYIDSLIKSNAAISQLLDNHSLFISAHVSGATSFDFLYVYSLPNRSYQSSVEGFIKRINNNTEPFFREYSGVDIGTVHPNNRDSLSYAFFNGILIMSGKPTLVEDGIRQMKSGISLAMDKNFSKIINTTGKNVDANVYVNYKNFPNILNRFISPVFKKEINSLADFADCSGWDATIKPNALMLNGFTQVNDSSTNFLNIFKDQKPQEIELTKVIPSKTALMLWFGIENIKTFHRNYKKYLKSLSQVRAQAYAQYIESLDEKYDINIEKSMLEWIGSEMALVVTESPSNDFVNNSYAVIHSNNIDEAVIALNSMADSINRKEKPLPASPSGKLERAYRNHTITHLNLPKVLPQLFGWQFNKITNNYYTSIEDYIVFANSKEPLQNFIDDFENNKILGNNKNYKIFSENISIEANVYLYSSIARSANMYSAFVTEELAQDIENKLDLFHKFEAVGIQFSATKKLFYSTAYLKYNPKYKQESGTMWESELDTTLSSKPYIVINHTNKSKEIVIQDDANKLYLISNTGKIIWTKQLSGKIMSDIVQVDAFKNSKLQLLFNTHNEICMLDRNGNYMKGFPVKLESPATNAITVVDYEKNRDYRIFVACENKKIRCFKSNGEENKAFKFNKTNNKVFVPLQYVQVENKDVLCTVDEKGKIYLLNRQGEIYNTIATNQAEDIRHFYIEPGKDFNKTTVIAADASGNIIKVSFAGKKESIKMDDFDSRPFFDYEDINNDTIKEYVFLSNKELKVFSKDKVLLFNHEFKETISQTPLFFHFPDGTGKIGVLSEKTNELYLFNDNGSLYKGFPLEGKTLFSIGDMNNNGIYNIITGSDNTIYLYQLE
ncbi:MAG: DUF3352 domain-containing protein [Bacteroidetes bacterium]|nr:DUF3352 domain-containing protein [Bacteroidota bacterium]